MSLSTFGSLRDLILPAALLLTTACSPQHTVDIDWLTEPRNDQPVSDETIELVEGQALAVGVQAMLNRRLKGWSIDASSSDTRIFSVELGPENREDKDKQNWVISGLSPGTAELEFTLKGKFEVLVEVEVLARPRWTPTVGPPSVGGAGGANN